MHNIAYVLLDIFARGGGGGSGGGGGGGGGGSGGSGGSGGGTGSLFIIVALIGFMPAYRFANYLKSKHKGMKACVTMFIVSFVYGAAWLFIGPWGILIALGAFAGGPFGYFSNVNFKGALSRGLSARKSMQTASVADPTWDPVKVQTFVNQSFMDFQNDWSIFNLSHILTYVTADYGKHVGLMLQAIKLRGRRDQMDNVKLLSSNPVEVNDFPDNSQDNVTFLMHGQASDKLIETVDGQDKVLFVDNSDFYEYWHFARQNDSWVLSGISQMTEDESMINQQIKAFAEANGMYYSPDWGWLLLPSRGQLFSAGKFGTSDINNHVIGYYNQLLVELYSYIPNPRVQANGNTKQYVIAQAALPKRYDSIVVEAKGSKLHELLKSTPKGYNKISLEWPDFNARYNVYATNVEQVTAFELLHPVYMEKLFALPFKVNIEVVDNVVYLYSLDSKADYGTMYSLLQDAFKEMRL